MIYDLSSFESERSAIVNQISFFELCAETASQCQEITVHISVLIEISNLGAEPN